MKTAIALGTFDGLHSGHRAVLQACSGMNGVAVTFRIPPKSAAEGTQLLMLPEDKAERIISLGANRVDMLEFDAVKDIKPQEFLENIKKKYNPARICCGFNYQFGHKKSGNADTIKNFCQENGIEFCCIEPVLTAGEAVSSTAIREMVANGEIEKANEHIFGGFSFCAEVQHGDMRGRTLGFPTINQRYPELLVTPKFGVYETEVKIGDKTYKGITNIGHRPTYETQQIGCETYIKGFSREIYGEQVTLKLIRFIRPEIKFSSKNELKAQIENDVKSLSHH